MAEAARHCGSMDFTLSVGVTGEDKNIFYGVAYNGEGVAFSQTAGRIICELMAGEESELTKPGSTDPSGSGT
jgi:glycine/D-amino acid oxidase-like deaminating enzyme